MTYRLSLLDKSPVPPGATAAEALRSTLALAQRAEALGYHRFWVAEHHGNPGLDPSWAGARHHLLLPQPGFGNPSTAASAEGTGPLLATRHVLGLPPQLRQQAQRQPELQLQGGAGVGRGTVRPARRCLGRGRHGA